MPRTSHGVADDQTVCQRPMVMRAVRTDGEELIASPYEDRVLRVDTSGDDAAVLKRLERKSVSEVGS